MNVQSLSVRGAVPKAIPFPHLVAAEFFNRNRSYDLLSWLEKVGEWEPAVGSYYHYDNIRFGDVRIPTQVSWILNPSGLAHLGRFVEEHFQVSVRPQVRVMAHRLRRGDGIGLHTDVEAQGVVLNVYLNRGWSDGDGGHLVLFNSRDETDIASLYRPVHNCAVALVFSPVSFHAVSEVHRGERFAISYFFPFAGRSGETRYE